MSCLRQNKDDFFCIHKARPGRYRACVDTAPGTQGRFRYCRDAVTREAARQLLICLRQELARQPGPVARVLEAWYRKDLCKD